MSVSRAPDNESRHERSQRGPAVLWVLTAVGLVSVIGAGLVAPVRGSTDQASSTAEAPSAPNAEQKGSSDEPLPTWGPAAGVPKEVLALLDQRKTFLDRREAALRVEQARLDDLKRDIEELLDRYEKTVTGGREKQLAEQQAKEEEAKRKAKAEAEAEAAERKAKLDAVTKIYETMPAEEAAARIEHMPPDMAVKVLRSVKSKTAGSILALVRPAKAAKLTEQLAGSPPKSASRKK